MHSPAVSPASAVGFFLLPVLVVLGIIALWRSPLKLKTALYILAGMALGSFPEFSSARYYEMENWPVTWLSNCCSVVVSGLRSERFDDCENRNRELIELIAST
jgi:hypothetical protein